MVSPGPDDLEIQRILTMAVRVPDHGKLTPWRFVTIGKDQRQELALLLRQALQAEDPCATPAHHEKADEFASQGEGDRLLEHFVFPSD